MYLPDQSCSKEPPGTIVNSANGCYARKRGKKGSGSTSKTKREGTVESSDDDRKRRNSPCHISAALVDRDLLLSKNDLVIALHLCRRASKQSMGSSQPTLLYHDAAPTLYPTNIPGHNLVTIRFASPVRVESVKITPEGVQCPGGVG